MYNEQLEKLIDYALADGELTEKEKQVLFKKAESMGVDLDEFEMVLDEMCVNVPHAERCYSLFKPNVMNADTNSEISE